MMGLIIYVAVALVTALVASFVILKVDVASRSTPDCRAEQDDGDRFFAAHMGALAGFMWPVALPVGAFAGLLFLVLRKIRPGQENGD